ncbi:MAG: hypothetical protein EP330_12905 [Deltaproteobacteria bacterium]|nr:MAG: hypothetical protein EP330_12905 [Deltaproteobacteria bacterium]
MMRLLLAALLLPGVAEAGAWTRSLGSYYAKTGVDLYAAGTYQAADVVSTEGQRFLGWQVGVYGEVGLLKTHPLMVSVQAPFASNTLYLGPPEGGLHPRATTRRLGDLRLSVQTSVLPDGGPLSVAFEAKIPMYANDSVGDAFGGYEELFPLAGEGQLDFTGWLLGGASFGGPLWGEAALGYQHRTEVFLGWNGTGDLAFSDRLRFGAGLGLTKGRLIAILRVDGQKSLAADDGVTAENLSTGPVVLFDVAEGIAIEGRLAADVWARNATRGMGYGTGVSIRR